jgi:type II secretory pathway pseudopilin PulG
MADPALAEKQRPHGDRPGKKVPGTFWPPPPPSRRGITLVELLVVVGILVVLAMITVPMMQPLSEGRRIREAARAINVYFSRARSKAIQTGRPCGVMLQRLDRQPQACTVLRQAEVPPPYAGEMPDAVVSPIQAGPGVLRLRVRPLDMAPGLIRRGDAIQLNNQGPWYVIFDFPDGAGPDLDFPVDPITGFINFNFNDSDGDGWIDNLLLSASLASQGPAAIPWPGAWLPNGPRVPFQILRQPVASSEAPLQLARGAVVDLVASGFDSTLPDWATHDVAHNFEPDMTNAMGPQPVVVMFAPNGSVQGVYYAKRAYDAKGTCMGMVYEGRPVVEPIHLLVGKWECIPAAARNASVNVPDAFNPATYPDNAPQAESGLYNWLDATNLWVTLHPQTGLVTVAELYADLPAGAVGNPYPNTSIPSGATLSERLFTARTFARESQISKGGR